jgi:hypothetical protein
MNCTSFLLCFFEKKHNNDNNKLKKNQNKCLSGSSSGQPENSLKFLKRDSIAVSSEYSELKYWFNEFIKYVIIDYNNYRNKEELLDTVWKYIDIIEVSKYHNMYKSKYSGVYSEKNMLEFYNFVKNTDFKKKIVSIVYIYRMH